MAVDKGLDMGYCETAIKVIKRYKKYEANKKNN